MQREGMLPRSVQVLAWIVCASVLGALSLLPAGSVPRTSLGNHAEHAIVYAAAAFLVVLAQHPTARALFLLTLYAAALEYLQRFSPGRTPHLEDFLFSAFGILTGIVAGYGFKHLWTAVDSRSQPATYAVPSSHANSPGDSRTACASSSLRARAQWSS